MTAIGHTILQLRLCWYRLESLGNIATELRNYASSVGYNVNTLGDQFFKDMVWGGLTETDVFKNSKTIAEQNRIKDRINAEIKGESVVRAVNNSNGGYTNIVTAPKALKACD
ncbi:hypothetical protein BC751_1605 [Cecembia calidifontis]|uniref:Uncharacterized protein n=1 Tax=Cecembia calidifontis TaxID=1187080 RepID=A0A4Q7P955_9BACT|nr:hypothetical protein BC751_1605 [Cecembia calidifontis]